MKFKLTGGQDGVSGIEVAGKRYEPGDEIELTEAKAGWLVEAGYLVPADPKKAAKYAPVQSEPEPAVEEAPEAPLEPEVQAEDPISEEDVA